MEAVGQVRFLKWTRSDDAPDKDEDTGKGHRLGIFTKCSQQDLLMECLGRRKGGTPG